MISGFLKSSGLYEMDRLLNNIKKIIPRPPAQTQQNTEAQINKCSEPAMQAFSTMNLFKKIITHLKTNKR